MFCLVSSICFGQTTPDSIMIKSDTLNLIVKDSLTTPSPDSSSLPQTAKLGYKISKDAIDKKIVYNALDSNITDVKTKEISLFTDADVQYEQSQIKADKIVINFQSKLAKGWAKKLDNGDIVRGDFSDGATSATYHELAYKFDNQKGFAKNLKSKEGEFHILGEKSKFVSGVNDSIYNHDKIFNEKAIITTCNLDHPHFGIYTKRLKFIPDKYAVMGPSQLVLSGVPTPIVLPFGFLPLIQGQSSGLIFPQNYEYNGNLGFGLREIGYYFPINDYIDLRITGDIYTRGTHAVRVHSNYKKRYLYQGNFNLGYRNELIENNEGKVNSAKSFSVYLKHTQDAKAHPYRTIGGLIDISSNQHNRRSQNDAKSVLTNQYRSSFSLNYKFPDSPFKLGIGFEHSQNTNTNVVDVTLPSATLNMTTINPFKRKNQVGDRKWYEDISLDYNAKFKSRTVTTDTTLFEQETIDKLTAGFNHTATVAYNSKIFKYFNISPRIRYNEVYNLKRNEKYFDPTLLYDTIYVDTTLTEFTLDTTFGKIHEELVIDPIAFREVDFSTSINTQLFGTMRFKKGFIRGIRHIIKPSISFNYNPSTRNVYERYVESDTRDEYNRIQAYNPIPSSPYSSNLRDRGLSINYRFNNTLEAKYWSKKDSTSKNFKIFQNLTFSGNYNIAKDSLNWSNTTLRTNTRVLWGISNLDLTLINTFYEIDENGNEYNSFLLDNNKFPLQFKQFRLGLNSGITVKRIVEILSGKIDSNASQNNDSSSNTNLSLIGVIDNFSISHNYQLEIRRKGLGINEIRETTHTLGIRGRIPLTKNWNINLSNISYNLKTKKLVYPSLGFERDLHCWTMNFGWHPSSKVYNFFIGVKSSALSFLKYDYDQNTF